MTTTVRLCTDNTPEITLSVRVKLWEQLAKLAIPVVEHYLSDLYHDALWIERHVNEPTVFYFATRAYGTSIGTDREAVAYGNDVLHTVALTHDRGWDWNATFERLDREGDTSGAWVTPKLAALLTKPTVFDITAPTTDAA